MSPHTGQRIAQNTALIAAALVGQKLLAFLYFTMIARQMDVEDTGRYFLATSFALLFAVLADIGLAPFLIRETAKLRDGVQSKLATILGAKLVLTILTLVFINGVAWCIPSYPMITRVLIAIASLSVLFESWNVTWYGILRGWQRLEFEAAGILIGQGMTVLVGLFFLFTTNSVALLVLALVLGNGISFVWGFLMVKRVTRVSLRMSFAWHEQKVLMVTIFPFAFAAIFNRITGFSDSFVLSLFGTEAMVGLYSVPFKVVFAFQFIPLALAAALLPAMSADATNRNGHLARTYTRSTLFLFYIALPLVLGLVALADIIIPVVFGTNYIDAVLTLQVLAWTLVFLFMSFPVGSLMIAVNRQKAQTTLVGIVMGIGVVWNVLFIPRIGILAPAIASVIANGTLFVAGFFLSRQSIVFPLAPFLGGLAKAAVAGGGMTLFLLTAKGTLHLALLVILGGIIYCCLMLLLRAVTINDLRSLRPQQ